MMRGERQGWGMPPLDEDFKRSKTLNVRFVVVAMLSRSSTCDGDKRGLLQGSSNIGGGRRRGVKQDDRGRDRGRGDGRKGKDGRKCRAAYEGDGGPNE